MREPHTVDLKYLQTAQRLLNMLFGARVKQDLGMGAVVGLDLTKELQPNLVDLVVQEDPHGPVTIYLNREAVEASPLLGLLALAHAWGHVLTLNDADAKAHGDAFGIAEAEVLRVLLDGGTKPDKIASILIPRRKTT